MRSLKFGFALAVLVAPAFAGPAWNTAAPAKTFTYKGAAIHPACLDSMELKEGETIDLKACTAEARKAYFKPSFKDGLYTADGRDKTQMRPVFSSYSVVANLGATFVIETLYSGGGSGIFSTLQIVSREGNVLRIKKFIAGGDRCNGGISSTSITGDKLTYSANFTPYDVIAEPRSEELKGRYGELSSAAISCVATNDMEWDLSTGSERRVGMTLTGDWYTNNGEPGTALEPETGDDVNACFNRLYNSYFRQQKTNLDPAELTAFRKTFFSSCKK